MNLKIGDVVKLKSGGPWMTVNREFEYGNVGCIWFANGNHQLEVVASEALIRRPKKRTKK